MSVDYGTQDGTATTADSDYDQTSGTLTFDPGQTTKSVVVKANGDVKVELAETFELHLSNPGGATIADGTGVGTIPNDDRSYPRPGGHAAVRTAGGGVRRVHRTRSGSRAVADAAGLVRTARPGVPQPHRRYA